MKLSVVIPSHDPDPERLRRTLRGLAAQSLPAEDWELVLIDNASRRFPATEALRDCAPRNLRVAAEPRPGLTRARMAGVAETKAPIVVFADDDNVLAPDYLEQTARLLGSHPEVGACGGRSVAEFERQPEAWQREFLPLLALRDPGDLPRISRGLRPDGAAAAEYPVDAAPIGAGMAIRREAAMRWTAESDPDGLPDRRGADLTSGGDNDIVLTIMRHGWEVAYFPELRLTHLIPAARLEAGYLARLNRAVQRSWMRVLLKHGASPWPAIPRWTVPLRKAKAWFAFRAWSGPAAFVRWQGACGHFEGRSRT